MASPIFISNPSHHFSFLLVLRSIHLTIISIYRTLQNPDLFSREVCGIFMKSFKISILFYLITTGLLNLTKLIFRNTVLRLCNGDTSCIVCLEHFINNYSNLNIFLFSMYIHFDPNIKTLFLSNLRFSDTVLSTYYHNKLKALEKDEAPYDDWRKTFRHLWKHSRDFRLLLRRYMNLYLLNISIWTLTLFPGKISTIILATIVFRTCTEKLGTMESLVLVSVLGFCDYYYTSLILTTFYGATNLGEDLATVYLKIIHFAPLERQQWINTRQGVLFGIGLVYYLSIYTFPQIAMVIYSFAVMSMGYIIVKITTPPPSTPGRFHAWCTGESIWNNYHLITNGDFVNDQFISSPLYILTSLF